MTKLQEIKIKMVRSVLSVLTVFVNIVKLIPGLSECQEELNTFVEDTHKFNQGQLNKGTELTQKKEENRKELIKRNIQICAALVAYATTSTDANLKPLVLKYQLSDSSIKRLRDMQLFALSYKVYGDALPYAANLSPFATADEVNGLKTMADNFNEMIPKKRTQRSSTVLSTSNLGETMDKIELLLKEKMDILVKPLESKEVDFYKSYQNARKVESTSKRNNKNDSNGAIEPDDTDKKV